MIQDAVVEEPNYEEAGGEAYFAFPLTPGQAAMWPAGPLSEPRFNGSFRMSLTGPIEAPLLQEAFRRIADRQESLRTVFSREGDEVLQIVLPHSGLVVETADLSGVEENARVAEMERLCAAEARTPFALEAEPPLRVGLIRMSEQQAVLTVTLCQIACDGWSIGLLLEELARVYTALAQEQEPTVTPLAFSYGDYVLWSQENSAYPECQKQLGYWTKQLAGCVPAKIVFDEPTSDAQTSDAQTSDEQMRGGLDAAEILSELLPKELTDSVRALAQAHNATMFVLTLTAWLALLHRSSGAEDLAVLTPLSGRNRAEFEPIIGQFVNQAVLRSRITEGTTLRGLLERVRTQVWEALANQDVPFAEVLRALPEPRAAEEFAINFVCQHEYGRNGPSAYRLGEATLTTMPSASQGALYDLNLFLVERPVGWRVSLEYRTGRYRRATAADLLRRYLDLLRALAETPDEPVLGSKAEGDTPERVPDPATETQLPEPKGASEAIEDGGEAHPGETIAMPASLAQGRYWALSEIDPSNAAFHIPVVMRLSGQVSEEALERSFQTLVDRHESLRSCLVEMDGELMQVISPEFRFALEGAALTVAEGEDAEAALERVIQAEVTRPFDLSRLPLLRAVLCHRSAEDHVLVVTLHHAIGDAWSVQVLQRELWTTYDGLVRDAVAPLPAMPLQYGDFAVWQKEALPSAAMQEHLRFWMDSLRGELPVVRFPTDREPDASNTPAGAVATRLLPEELTRSLREAARSAGTTLFVMTMTAFAAMLAKASGDSDVMLGSPVANRRAETEQLIGPMAGPTALRLQFPGDPTLRELLALGKEKTLAALEHAELPFEVLLDRLTVRPVEGRTPLFQFYFFCQPAFLQPRTLDSLSITPLPTRSLGIAFELQLGVIEREEGVRAELEYNSSLFDRATVESWLGYYERVLGQLAENPDQRLSELPAAPFLGQARSGRVGEAAQAAQLSVVPAGEGGPEAEADDITEEIRGIWQSMLGVAEVGLSDNFFVLGGRSLTAARLLAAINKKYALKLGLATLFSYPTVAEIARLVRGRSVEERPRSIVAIQPKGTQTPLFVVHGVGGNVLNFYDLAQQLGPDQPVYGVEAHALQPDVAPLTGLPELAAYYVAQIRKVLPAGPYRLLGYSFGGFLAFEMGRQLQEQGAPVEMVGVLDTPIWRHRYIAGGGPLRTAGRQTQAVVLPFLQRLRPFTPTDLVNALKSVVLRSSYSVLAHTKRPIPRILRSVYHVNSFAAVNYEPRTYRGRVTVLRAAAERGPRDLGWGEWSTDAAEVFEFPGAHLQILSDKNLPGVAASLREVFGQRRRAG